MSELYLLTFILQRIEDKTKTEEKGGRKKNKRRKEKS